MQKITQLAMDYGFENVQDMLEGAVCDSVAPGICMNDDCDYSTEVEPDCTDGYCEMCGSQNVVSCLILAGIC